MMPQKTVKAPNSFAEQAEAPVKKVDRRRVSVGEVTRAGI
jgi:hypothetical protein